MRFNMEIIVLSALPLAVCASTPVPPAPVPLAEVSIKDLSRVFFRDFVSLPVRWGVTCPTVTSRVPFAHDDDA